MGEKAMSEGLGGLSNNSPLGAIQSRLTLVEASLTAISNAIEAEAAWVAGALEDVKATGATIGQRVVWLRSYCGQIMPEANSGIWAKH
ncbi:MAG: hypothetical protein KGQ48_00580 [Bradyrhizobium sp.]|nr:hypothetical protein [Bradyrhizobium sp.]